MGKLEQKDRDIHVRGLRSGNSYILKGHSASVNALAFVYNGRTLASGGVDRADTSGTTYDVADLADVSIVMGGWLLSALGMAGPASFIGSLIVAIVGAVLILYVLRAFSGRRAAY